MTIAFDTNVLIYSCDGTDPERQAKALAVLSTDDEAVLFWQVAVEFIAASRKLAERGMTNQQAWERLGRFQDAFRLVLPTPRVLEGAKRLHVEQQSSFWDALIVAACLDAGVTRLYSEDLPGRAPPEGPRDHQSIRLTSIQFPTYTTELMSRSFARTPAGSDLQ